MIFITGDCHGDFEKLYNFDRADEMTKRDFVIVAGDFGYWHDSYEQDRNFKRLNNMPFTTLFVDGNHENFDGLYSIKQEDRWGGKVRRVSDSIFHLSRGQLFTLQGKTFFTFGGARSHDIQDGIIDVRDPGWRKDLAILISQGKSMYRMNHLNWWKEEMPSDAEYEEGTNTLKSTQGKIDFIVTHCAPTSTAALLGFGERDKLTAYLEDVRTNTQFGKWYFGHYHLDRAVNAQEICLYNKIVQIA